MYGGEVDVCRQNGDSRDEQLLKKGLMMAEDKPVVESFQLDHTKVKAPYVRYIDTQTGPNGDVISNYDCVWCSRMRMRFRPVACTPSNIRLRCCCVTYRRLYRLFSVWLPYRFPSIDVG